MTAVMGSDLCAPWEFGDSLLNSPTVGLQLPSGIE
jgi:hypothetical protein